MCDLVDLTLEQSSVLPPTRDSSSLESEDVASETVSFSLSESVEEFLADEVFVDSVGSEGGRVCSTEEFAFSVDSFGLFSSQSHL